jgi:hypothetical protein
MACTRIAVLALLVMSCAAATSSAAAPQPAAKSIIRHTGKASEWPDTKVGQRARGWVEAFSSGDSAMRVFIGAQISKESLAKRGVDERIANYLKLHERLGKLTLVSVGKQTPVESIVTLVDSNMETHEFTFDIEPVEPYKLASVSLKERVNAHGMAGFHH